MARRSEPQRRCAGCRESAPKRELLRIVAATDRTPFVDPTGTAPGRGAYVHRTEACVAAATRGGLARALRITIGPEEASNLLTALRTAIEEA